MNKKNIDNLFQEKFRDFGEMPDESVWQSIETSLDKKKKSRRIIPFWWQLGGVAALLALMLYVINPFADDTSGDPGITDVENTDMPTTKDVDSLKKDTFKTPEEQKEGVVVSQGKEDKSVKEEENHIDKQPSYATTDSQKTSDNKSDKNKKFDATAVQKNLQQKKEQLTTIKENENTSGKSLEKNDLTPQFNKEKEAVAVTDIEKNQKKIDGKDPSNQNNDFKNLKKDNDTKEAVVTNEKSEEKNDDPKKKSIFDEIEKKEQEEEAIAENNSKNRWSAGPSVAPVYFNGIGEGSPVHSIFVPNSKSGNVNLSYGVTVAYEINDRLSVRSGVHKVDYGYDTNDVAFSSSLDGSTNDQIDNISYKATSKNLVLQSRAPGNAEFSSDFATNDVTAKSPGREGLMSQQFGYLEVPLELNYALVDKKVGVNLVGGFSSLFLVNNSVTVEGDGQIMELGEANNVNDINFSTNIGIGVNYKFTPKVQLNLEPVFKYQLNTFSETDGTFQPFSVGVYSGLTFRF